MSYNAENYIHDMDRKAFAVLNSFPKFIKLCEAYSANYDEKLAKIELLSTGIRLSENQMPEIYNLLPPICEKLGIGVPELYYIKSKEMNAATIGTKNPVIYVTSQLVKKMPKELVASVLAHECGHIACKHSLYHSIAMSAIRGIRNIRIKNVALLERLLSPNLINALMFWVRCSELSADRAAALCDGTADHTVDALLKLKGYGDDINKEEFIKQAIDLKDFVNGSKSNKAMEQMLIKGESHPRLATRIYECFEWSKTDIFRSILDGTYHPDDTVEIETEEVLTAEVNLETVSSITETMHNVPPMEEIDKALARVNSELDRYTNMADKGDYAAAIFSGIVSGVIDAVFVGKADFINGEIGLSHHQVNNFIQEYAKARGLRSERLEDAIGDLEKSFKVAQDNVWKGAGIGVAAKNHHLADFAHHPTPFGLMSSIVVQLLKVGTFMNRDGEWHFVFVKCTAGDLVQVLTPVIITAVLNWLVAIAEKKYEEEHDTEIPKALDRLVHLVASTPIIIEIAKVADNWFGHLVSDMGGSKNTAGGGMGIPGIFISLLYEISSIPGLKDSGLPKFLDDLYVNRKLDLRHELCLYKDLGKQTIPVIFNEIYVRLLFFVGRLVTEVAEKEGLKNINWKNTVPFGNRTVDRMLTVASMTFTMADTADAAIHAAIESCGNWVLFSGAFVSRFNYIGAGRAAYSIVKEISKEKREAQLIHEKLLLTNTKTVGVIEHFEKYREALEEKIANYLAEDIEGFLSGFDYLEQGIATGDSDLVIKGNVIIQKVLGREPQFTNQKEFDELMDSDISLSL